MRNDACRNVLAGHDRAIFRAAILLRNVVSACHYFNIITFADELAFFCTSWLNAPDFPRGATKLKGLGFVQNYIEPVKRLILWLERTPYGKLFADEADSKIHAHGFGMGLNIMSFNVRRGTRRDGRNHWVHRRSLVKEVLERYRPDVLGLQEALDFQIGEIRAMLPGYDVTGLGNWGGSRGLHTAIFYDAQRFMLADSGTFWFSPTPYVPGSRGWGNIIPRTCTWARLVELKTRRAFYFYNVHLDHLSRHSRRKSVVLLARHIQARPLLDPFILGGDFNAGEENPSIRYLKGQVQLKFRDSGILLNPIPLRDTFRDRYPNHARVGTYHGFGRFFFRFKLDYIFVPPSVHIREARIIEFCRENCYPSDHFPLYSRIVLPPFAAAS